MKTSKFLLILLTGIIVQCSSNKTQETSEQGILPTNIITVPSLFVNGQNTHEIVKAYRIAIGDVMGNIQHHQSGILEQKVPCI